MEVYMHKTVLFLSFFGMTLLFVLGLFWPDNAAVWLASTSKEFAFIRLSLMAAFGMLLVTVPPRSIWLRKFLGIFAVVVAAWALEGTYGNHMKFLDSLSLLEFSVCTAIAVLEQTGEELLQTVSSKKAQLTEAKRKKLTA
jgi:hypothetical protein